MDIDGWSLPQDLVESLNQKGQKVGQNLGWARLWESVSHEFAILAHHIHETNNGAYAGGIAILKDRHSPKVLLAPQEMIWMYSPGLEKDGPFIETPSGPVFLMCPGFFYLDLLHGAKSANARYSEPESPILAIRLSTLESAFFRLRAGFAYDIASVKGDLISLTLCAGYKERRDLPADVTLDLTKTRWFPLKVFETQSAVEAEYKRLVSSTS